MTARGDPEVHFDKLTTSAVPFDDELMILTYRPRPGPGWVLANCWHERAGIVTAVMRREAAHAVPADQ